LVAVEDRLLSRRLPPPGALVHGNATAAPVARRKEWPAMTTPRTFGKRPAHKDLKERRSDERDAARHTQPATGESSKR